ncbi:hypothetical protein AB1Y20_013705 [Prymnesium parvum]|uniref:Uncharacterized protein n=1 Tax=Prymnesium parvum TaxID=97485 RepID=A0AB34IIY8_PRYPA
MPHTFRLHREARERGVAVAGSVSTLSARLSARAPVSIAVLGSSVAEQGGCNRQAGKECQRFDGVEYAKPGWGRPPKRPFKGWAVRLLDWLNESWPHEQHTLYNGAQSATPLHTALPCLFSFLPPQSDLVIIEPMSMG